MPCPPFGCDLRVDRLLGRGLDVEVGLCPDDLQAVSVVVDGAVECVVEALGGPAQKIFLFKVRLAPFFVRSDFASICAEAEALPPLEMRSRELS